MKTYNGFYLVGNYPDKETFIKAAVMGLEYFDFLEVGFPFSEPVADGPIIAKAVNETLKKGIKAKDIFESIKEIKKQKPNKDIYIMSYANSLFNITPKKFGKIANEIGIKGIIVADIPNKEAEQFSTILRKYEIDYIHFLTPENTNREIEKISKKAKGFIYFISIRGITGNKLYLDNETIEKIKLAKKFSKVPVVIGFGIKNKKDIEMALKYGDGFIIGTQIIQELNKDFSLKKLKKYYENIFS